MITKTDGRLAAPLFGQWPDTTLWSCLENSMGTVYSNDSKTPRTAAAVLGDFCFTGGTPDDELLHFVKTNLQKSFFILVPTDPSWEAITEQYFSDSAKKVYRYALKKEPEIFLDGALLDRLRTVTNSLPEPYSFRMIDEGLYHWCKTAPEADWCRDWTAQYETWADYQEHGLGVTILYENTPVAGASSYSSFRNFPPFMDSRSSLSDRGGIEIEIDTRIDHRRKGLAYACGAKLILTCAERGLYPSWDAQNLWSKSLAEKLGYHFDGAYPAYEIRV